MGPCCWPFFRVGRWLARRCASAVSSDVVDRQSSDVRLEGSVRCCCSTGCRSVVIRSSTHPAAASVAPCSIPICQLQGVRLSRSGPGYRKEPPRSFGSCNCPGPTRGTRRNALGSKSLKNLPQVQPGWSPITPITHLSRPPSRNPAGPRQR